MIDSKLPGGACTCLDDYMKGRIELEVLRLTAERGHFDDLLSLMGIEDGRFESVICGCVVVAPTKGED